MRPDHDPNKIFHAHSTRPSEQLLQASSLSRFPLSHWSTLLRLLHLQSFKPASSISLCQAFTRRGAFPGLPGSPARPTWGKGGVLQVPASRRMNPSPSHMPLASLLLGCCLPRQEYLLARPSRLALAERPSERMACHGFQYVRVYIHMCEDMSI